MSTKDTLLTVDDALGASPKQVSAWFKKYFNPSLALTLEMAEFDAIYDRAEGSVVYSEGTAYKDFLGGYGAVGVGHNHPDVIAAVEKVKGRPNILQGSLQPLTAALAHNLAQVSPGKLEKSFFTNSGAEAVEGALKIVRAATGRKRIIYAENAFHGKTFGALSATGKKKYRTPFEPLVPGFEAVPFGDIEALESALAGSDVAAFIVEPIQGEAGVILPPSGYLSDCERVCRSYETLLIVDEIQTGLGRTGSMFACEDEDVEPDVLCVAKALGGAAVPIGAYISTDEVWQRAYSGIDRCLTHTTTTFGGTAWGCAAAMAVLELLTRNGNELIAEVKEKGARFHDRLDELKDHGIVNDVRGRGLMLGVEFNQPKAVTGKAGELFKEYFAQLVVSELRNKHRILAVYTLNNPNVVRLMPPLGVRSEDLDQVVDALDSVCREKFRGTLVSGGLRAGKNLLAKGGSGKSLVGARAVGSKNPLDTITIPTLLTIARLLAIPFFLFFMLGATPQYEWAAVVLAGAGATDWLDGFLARRLDQETDFGAFFDPLVDRLLVFAVLLSALAQGIVPLVAVSVIVMRDLLLIAGYQFLSLKSRKMAVTMLGKTTTAFIAISFILVLLDMPIGMLLFYVSVVLSVVSGIDYFLKGFRELGEAA